MTTNEFEERVRRLHTEGASTNAIARSLGVDRGEVAPLVRSIRREQRAPMDQPAVVGCWVSRGWSAGLDVDADRDWPDRAGRAADMTGLVGVVVARESRRNPQGVTVCGYLVDTYCLGVKNALGPRPLARKGLKRFVRTFFAAFDGAPIEVPLDLAQHLVLGAVDFAADLGFRPHPDFRPASAHLGALDGPCAIRFGHDGTPCYIQGPCDDVPHVMRTLERRLGPDGFNFTMEADLFEMAQG